MEPLVEVRRERWPSLRDLYLPYFPDGATAYCLLNMHIAHPRLMDPFQLKVYCPEGDLSNGMIATSLRQNFYQVVIQPIGKNVSKLEESLLTTKIIDWGRERIIVPSANKVAIDCLERVKDKLGIKVFYGTETAADMHFLDKNSIKQDLNLPPNIYIGPLRSEFIDIVDKSWTYHGNHTHEIFEILGENNLSYVLYSRCETKEDADEKRVTDEPMAWLSVNEHGSLSHLFCAEQYRRKGYAALITKHVTNELLSKGLNSIAYTIQHNEGAKKLFKRLGFEDIGRVYWVILSKI